MANPNPTKSIFLGLRKAFLDPNKEKNTNAPYAFFDSTTPTHKKLTTTQQVPMIDSPTIPVIE